jgi:hypothetical protein
MLEISDNVAEYVTNNRAKQQQNGNNHNGNKHKDQSIFYQTLTFFTRQEKHSKNLLSTKI